MASPVDTGRFRASWHVGENAAGSYDGGEQQPALANIKTTSPPKIQALAQDSIYQQEERIGNVYSVHNNLPYAEPMAKWQGQQAGRRPRLGARHR
jgi:hypothetical protein